MYSATLHYIPINKCILQCKTHYVRDCSEWIAAETEEHNHGQSLLPMGKLSQFHPYHTLASYFPVIQPTNLLGLSSEFCPRGSPRQTVHISRASHPTRIYTPKTTVASYTTQTPCIINQVSRHVTLNSPLTSCFSWPNIFLGPAFLNVPSKQQAYFTQTKTATILRCVIPVVLVQ